MIIKLPFEDTIKREIKWLIQTKSGKYLSIYDASLMKIVEIVGIEDGETLGRWYVKIKIQKPSEIEKILEKHEYKKRAVLYTWNIEDIEEIFGEGEESRK